MPVLGKCTLQISGVFPAAHRAMFTNSCYLDHAFRNLHIFFCSCTRCISIRDATTGSNTSDEQFRSKNQKGNYRDRDR